MTYEAAVNEAKRRAEALNKDHQVLYTAREKAYFIVPVPWGRDGWPEHITLVEIVKCGASPC